MASLKCRLDAAQNRPRGFDYLRLALALAVIAWHGVLVSYGRDAETPFWTGPLRPLIYFIVPGFFALSGFLVAGSLERNPIPQFLALRGIRIFPALAGETLISALIIGPLVTTLPLKQYFADQGFFRYFLNIIGIIHYSLPGVFADLPAPKLVNLQLWTVPYELDCYIAITILALCGIATRPLRLFAVSAAAMLSLPLLHEAGLLRDFQLNERPPGSMVVLSFLFGTSFFVMRRRIPFSLPLFLASLIAYPLLVSHVETMFLAVLPIVYITIFLGLCNPPRTPLIIGSDYSYGIYLYGFPLQQLVSYTLPSYRIWIVNVLLSTILAFGAAWLSWTFLEKRALDKKHQVLLFVSSLSGRLRILSGKIIDNTGARSLLASRPLKRPPN
jgi:peptidoglycan/LPS O-acetylase OafA/YrhL